MNGNKMRELVEIANKTGGEALLHGYIILKEDQLKIAEIGDWVCIYIPEKFYLGPKLSAKLPIWELDSEVNVPGMPPSDYRSGVFEKLTDNVWIKVALLHKLVGIPIF